MKRFFAAVAAAIFLALPAHADPCTLTRFATYDMIFTKGGHIAINLQMGDAAHLLTLDTGGVTGMLDGDVAKKMDLTVREARMELHDAYGRVMNGVVMVPFIMIGPVRVEHVAFYVTAPHAYDPDAVGTLAPNVLQGVDLELDFANKRVSFYSPDHCPGRVVYWTTGTTGVVPFELESDGHIQVTAQLDGKSVDAVLDTGAPSSIVSAPAAKETFGIDTQEPEDSGDEKTESGSIRNEKQRSMPLHSFTSLTLGDVSILNPTMWIMKDAMASSRLHRLHIPAVTIGLKELEHLHVYIAYKEHVIYVTPADAH